MNKLSKTQQALAMIAADPTLSASAAARAVGVAPATVLAAQARQRGRVVCPCCGQVVRDGFRVDESKIDGGR